MPSSAPALPVDADEPIAIIGLHGRYPAAPDLGQLWDNLRRGAVAIREVPPERWDHARLFEPETRTPERSYSKWGGFVDDIDKFDALFFNISPREAELLDPQERLFLETAWSTFEDAGYSRTALAGGDARVGVFVGVMHGSYQLHSAEAWTRGKFVNASSGFWSIANRVSYVMDLTGPSLAVDTACSSSLTALHLACESLRRGECEMALAGGVNLVLHPLRYLQLCQVRMLSRDERCRPFGEGASGFVLGEGVGAVLLKPLSRALADRDQIHAVIRGSSINSGGRTNGYTVPSPNAQGALVRQALQRAGVEPRTIGYIEAHGTGTALGDPIEIAGLNLAFGGGSRDRQSCALGSIKSNIGHLEAAAGIASLTKVVLMLKHRTLVPSLNAATPNPAIDFAASPFRLQRELADWPAVADAPRRAAVSSFGAGGANAHVILEEYAAPARPAAALRPELLVLSARQPEQLREYARRLKARLEASPAPALADVAHTLQVGREALDERLAIVAADRAEATRLLDAYLQGNASAPGIHTGNAGRRETAALQLEDAAEEREYVRRLHAAGRLAKLAAHWVAGSCLPWADLHAGDDRRRVSLPTYPFARIRCWIDPIDPAPAPESAVSTATPARPHPLIDANVSTAREVRFTRELRPEETFLRDHRVQGQPVLPAAAQLELMRAAARLAECGPALRLEKVVWMRPIIVGSEGRRVTAVLQPHARSGGFEVRVEEGRDGAVASKGLLVPDDAPRPAPLDLAAIMARCPAAETTEELYRAFARMGLAYGRSFQTLERLWRGRNETLARLQLPAEFAADAARYELYPGLLDGALQAIAGLFAGGAATAPSVPFALGALRVFGPLPAACHVHATSEKPAGSNGHDVVSLSIVDDAGNCLALLERLSCRTLRSAPPAAAPRAEQPAGLAELLARLERREISPEDAVRASTALLGATQNRLDS